MDMDTADIAAVARIGRRAIAHHEGGRDAAEYFSGSWHAAVELGASDFVCDTLYEWAIGGYSFAHEVEILRMAVEHFESRLVRKMADLGR